MRAAWAECEQRGVRAVRAAWRACSACSVEGVQCVQCVQRGVRAAWVSTYCVVYGERGALANRSPSLSVRQKEKRDTHRRLMTTGRLLSHPAPAPSSPSPPPPPTRPAGFRPVRAPSPGSSARRVGVAMHARHPRAAMRRRRSQRCRRGRRRRSTGPAAASSTVAAGIAAIGAWRLQGVRRRRN